MKKILHRHRNTKILSQVGAWDQRQGKVLVGMRDLYLMTLAWNSLFSVSLIGVAGMMETIEFMSNALPDVNLTTTLSL